MENLEEGTAVDEAQAGQPEETAEERAIRIGEEEVPYQKVEEAWKNYGNDQKWRARNTQESQKIAEERKALEKARALEEWLDRNPGKYEEVKRIFSQAVPEGQPKAEIPAEIEKVRTEVGTMVEEIRVAREMDALKGKFPKFFGQEGFEGKLVEYCLENRIGNLEHAFKLMTYDQRATEALKEGQGLVQAAKEKSRQLASPKGSGGTAGKAGALKGIRGFGPDFQRALADSVDFDES